jgi:hypothetical protein
MNVEERAKQIINQVLSMDERWGKLGAPRKDGSDKPSRIITDDPRWYARLTRDHEKGPDGEKWDLIEIFAREQLRMTAVFRGDQVDVRLYESGSWEPMFCLFNLAVLEPQRPNMGTKYET